MPTQLEMDQHYQTYYGRKKQVSLSNAVGTVMKSVLTWSRWYTLRHQSFLSLISRHARKGRLLDYGCGEGQMLLTAREKGWKVVGIDYSSENADRLRADGLDVRCAPSLASSGISQNSMDCIVAKHVIEHVVDIEKFLSDCRDTLKPDGVIAIKTPSRTSLRARLGLANWHFVNPPEHQWGFHPKCFRLLMESHGFEVSYLKDSLIVDELFCIARVSNDSEKSRPQPVA